MSYKLTEQETQSEAPKKLPYNLREKREKDAAYRTMIRADLADELYQKIEIDFQNRCVYEKQRFFVTKVHNLFTLQNLGMDL